MWSTTLSKQMIKNHMITSIDAEKYLMKFNTHRDHYNSSLKNLSIEPPHDLAIPLLAVYPEKIIIQKDTCTPMLSASLFTIARTWKQPKCPSTDEWIKMMWHNGTLLRHKREQTWVTCSNVDGDNRGWDAWMASPTQQTWVWVNSRSWWWTGRPGMLQSMGSQRVGHDWATELNWTEMDLESVILSEEREKQISYAYIWNLEKLYWWTYFQGRNRDADIENRFVNTVGEGEGGTKWESNSETYHM